MIQLKFKFANYWKNEIKIIYLSLSFWIILNFILIITTISKATSWQVLTGMNLGYVFSLIGFLLIVFSSWFVIQTQNYRLYFVLFLLRMLIYAIPIIIYTQAENTFNLLTIILSLGITTFVTYFVQIDFKKLMFKIKKLIDHIFTKIKK